MILKTRDKNPIIIFDNFATPYSLDGRTDTVFRENYEISCIDITPDMIPDGCHVRVFADSMIINDVMKGWVTGNPITYTIQLEDNIFLHFTDKSIANIYYTILMSDFENINIHEKYPELFL
jgi:hypothetical protein